MLIQHVLCVGVIVFVLKYVDCEIDVSLCFLILFFAQFSFMAVFHDHAQRVSGL